MRCKCKKGHIFEARYDSIVNHGRGCPICAKEKRSRTRKIPLKKIKKRFSSAGYIVDKSFNYEKDYKNNKTKIPCRCEKHPDKLLFLSLIQIDEHIKCPICKKESILFRKEKGYNIKEIKEIMGKDYILLDSFKDEDWIKGSHTVLHFSCKKHGEFSISINSIYRNSKCPLCGKENISKKQKIDFEEIKEAFKARGYILLSTKEDYKGVHSKLHYKCPHHPNKDLYITYDALKHGIGCPYCAKNGKYSFKEACVIYRENDFIPLFSEKEFNKAKNGTPLLVKCKKTNKQTKVSLNSVIQRGHVCPHCYRSKGEDRITFFLDTKGIDYQKEKTFEGCIYENKLRFDFYLPFYNLCIEY